MVRKKRSDYIYSRAYELAASGHHLEPLTIISALIHEGLPEAAEILDSPLIRNDLREVCARNWPGVPVIITEESSADAETGEAPPAEIAKPQP